MLKTLFAILLFTLSVLPCAHAGEYFSCDDMDHFSTEGDCIQKQKEVVAARQHRQEQQNESGFTKQEIEMWGEPQVDSNGHVSTKLPPLPAMRYLIDPSPENAKTYLQWNEQRMEAIQKGQSLLQAMSPELQGASNPSPQIADVSDIKMVDFFFAPT